jgi:hypothetical protein
MSKISQRDALRTTTMFLVDSRIEAYYEDLLNTQVQALKRTLNGIGTVDGLKQYVRSEKKAIDNIITLLGISGEKFKRVVSWIRLSKGYTFDSEWSNSSLRTIMLEDPRLMDEFCELFINGYASPRFSSIIPHFILQDFRIDNEVLKRLTSDDFVRRLVKDKVTIEYNTRYAELYVNSLHSRIKEIAQKHGVEFGKMKIPNYSSEELALTYNGNYIVINHHFYLTTSSSQTEYYNDVIQPKYAKAQSLNNVVVLNILDGAGWIGRAADFKKIYADCNFFLNLKSIDNLNNIITEFFNL